MDNFYVDPIAIARKEGIIVIPSSYLDVNGLIRKDKDTNEIVIEYDSGLHPNRQRFTIAHELGHYYAGHLNHSANELFRDPAKNFTLDNYDPLEAEANKIAAELLMPEEKIEFLIQKLQYNSIDALAEALIVSPAAMTYRLKNLGYIS
jgi:Zn-dependent peptidase ImmA (M78 family)